MIERAAKSIVRWALRRRSVTLVLAGLTNDYRSKRIVSAWYLPRFLRHLYARLRFGLVARWDGPRTVRVYRRGTLAMVAEFPN